MKLNHLFTNKTDDIIDYRGFWTWFILHEKQFYNVIKEGENMEKDFFDPITEKLIKIRDGLFMLAGMYDTSTAELIVTADGNLKKVIYAEELIAAAPDIKGWKFTALKPDSEPDTYKICLAGKEFTAENIFFYSNDDVNFPDEIDLTFLYADSNGSSEDNIGTGVSLFLENFLGELNYITEIDYLAIKPLDHAEKEPVPVSKLKSYLAWRKKEFEEKCLGVDYNEENAEWGLLKAELDDGVVLSAVIDTALMHWDSKVSCPWIMELSVPYQESSETRLPSKKDMDKIQKIDSEFIELMRDAGGCLHIGRETGRGITRFYYACRDFRAPVKTADRFIEKYKGVYTLEYDIHKDKYWRSFQHFADKC